MQEKNQLINNLSQPWTVDLLSEAEPHLKAEPRGGAWVGICYEWFIDCAFEVALHRELLVNNITDIGSQLEINVPVRNRAQVIYLPLDGLVVADGNVHPECDVVLQHDRPSLRLEGKLHIILSETDFSKMSFSR